MNATDFRFEQPWFLLLAILPPLLWFFARRFYKPPVIRFAAARIVRQPIGIENPTLLGEDELSAAVASCRKALELVPTWEAARSTLAIALVILALAGLVNELHGLGLF